MIKLCLTKKGIKELSKKINENGYCAYIYDLEMEKREIIKALAKEYIKKENDGKNVYCFTELKPMCSMERKLKRINNIIFEHERYASNNYITLSDDDYKKEYTAEVWETLGE